MKIERYPVYNHKNRPPKGENHFKEDYYSCFFVELTKDESGKYHPFTYLDFLSQVQKYKDFGEICNGCVNEHSVINFPANIKANPEEDVEFIQVNRSAVWEKFSHGNIEERDFYYCKLIREILDQATLFATAVPYTDRENLPADPFSAIFWGNHDDEYLFEFKKISPPRKLNFCSIYKLLNSKTFISSIPEKSIFVLWFLSVYRILGNRVENRREVYFEEKDFEFSTSKLFQWVFPIPHVWVNVISPPPPGMSWKEWESSHGQDQFPQRVDFMFIYNGKRHVVEIDDSSHFKTEENYRRTLNDTRWLKYCGYEVHRFTPGELFELCNPS